MSIHLYKLINERASATMAKNAPLDWTLWAAHWLATAEQLRNEALRDNLPNTAAALADIITEQRSSGT